MRLQYTAGAPASAARSAKREPEENFTKFGRVVIDFEHWRAASAALCAKRESEENFAILSPKQVDLEPSALWREMRARTPPGCGCEASGGLWMRMRRGPGCPRI